MMNDFSTKHRLGFAAILLLSSFARGQEDAAVVADNKVVRGSLRNLVQKVCKTRVLEYRDMTFAMNSDEISLMFSKKCNPFYFKNRM